MTFCSFGGYGINLVLTEPIFCSWKVTIFGCFNKCLQPMMLFNNVLKVVVAALFLHYDCFATFYEHALQHVFEEFALFGGTLSHIMLANSHCAKKTNYHFKTNKLPVLMNNPYFKSNIGGKLRNPILGNLLIRF